MLGEPACTIPHALLTWNQACPHLFVLRPFHPHSVGMQCDRGPCSAAPIVHHLLTTFLVWRA
jgi:hypothetical protein